MTIDISKYEWCEITGFITPKTRQLKRDYNVCNLTLHKRIGTDSSNAEVFQIEGKYALKIIPSLGRNEDQELLYATRASELVVKGVSPYFPIVYKTGDCPNTVYNQNSRSRYKSIRYHLDKIVDKKWIKKLAKNDDLYEILYDKDRVDLPSKYILSELVWGDLDQVYRLFKMGEINIDNSMWLKILDQIIKAIDDLQKHLGIVHNDLKFANILVAVDEDSDCLRVLLHDFGESYELVTEVDKNLDLNRILEQFKSKGLPLR